MPSRKHAASADASANAESARSTPSKAQSDMAENTLASAPPSPKFPTFLPLTITGSAPNRQSSLRNAATLMGIVSTPSELTSRTPVDTTSASGYSTPGTSNAPSPPPALPPSAAGESQGKASRIVVELPILSADKVAQYTSKRKLDTIDDSEDDSDLSDVSISYRLARELQEEEYRIADENAADPDGLTCSNTGGPRRRRVAATSALPTLHSTSAPSANTSLRRSARKANLVNAEIGNSNSDLESDDEVMTPSSTTIGKKKSTTPTTTSKVRPRRSPKTPPAKRRRAAAAAAAIALNVSEKEEDKFVVVTTSEDESDSFNDESEHKKKPKRAVRRGRRARAARPPVRTPTTTTPTHVVDSDENLGISAGESPQDELNDNENSPRSAQRNTERQRLVRARRSRRTENDRKKLEENHPYIKEMWNTLEQRPQLKLTAGRAAQPTNIFRTLKPFQLEGLAWMKAMEQTDWKGGLLGDEMGLGKTIQAVSLIMSDFPAKNPTLVLVPPVALMQWKSEIASYTDGTLKTFIFHGTNAKAKTITPAELKKVDVIMMSYNSLESIYRKQEKGFQRKNKLHVEKSVIHKLHFHRVILDEAHCIKTRTTMTAKACFALKADYRWCLSGTPLQNRIGELFSLIRFLNIRPFAEYLCRNCPCSTLEWSMDDDAKCSVCGCYGMQHVSLFNQELLNPIQSFGNFGPGAKAFEKLRLMTDRIMLRRLKKDHTDSMELPVKEIYVDRQFFGEEENDFASSIMTSGKRKFDTYVAQGVLLNNYANIFGLIMQMRQVADHPDLILKKNGEGGQNVVVCCICDEPAEDAIRSTCKHDFCRSCASSYLTATSAPDCPRCHIPLMIDLDQPEMEQDESMVKKSSIINRIKMENWTSSSKIELLVHELHKLRSDNTSHKSIIFSQFTTMLQLIEWRLHRAGITTVMLDGSMSPAQRQASIDHFMNNADVECFLVSLRAGGVALNLTEASRVFIVDPWWNPAAEWQSADRCHRIGQTRPCTITRLCIEDSVESRMVLIQEKKTSMIHSTVNADDKAIDALSVSDLQFLFRGH